MVYTCCKNIECYVCCGDYPSVTINDDRRSETGNDGTIEEVFAGDYWNRIFFCFAQCR
jgi:hypothetical protein